VRKVKQEQVKICTATYWLGLAQASLSVTFTVSSFHTKKEGFGNSEGANGEVLESKTGSRKLLYDEQKKGEL
jgi:hypothetical protein